MESSSWFVRQLKEKINGEKKMPNCGEEKKIRLSRRYYGNAKKRGIRELRRSEWNFFFRKLEMAL